MHKNWNLHVRCRTAIISDLLINLHLRFFFFFHVWIERQQANNLVQTQKHIFEKQCPKYKEISTISQSNLFPTFLFKCIGDSLLEAGCLQLFILHYGRQIWTSQTEGTSLYIEANWYPQQWPCWGTSSALRQVTSTSLVVSTCWVAAISVVHMQ